MKKDLQKKIVYWAFFSINLIIAFFSGVFHGLFNPLLLFIIISATILSLLILIYLYIKGNQIKINQIIFVSFCFILNLLFAFFIGFSIPFMTGTNPNNMGIVMVPLLCFLNYSIVDRLNIYIKEKPLQEEEGKEASKLMKDIILERDSKKEIGYWLLYSINLMIASFTGYLLSISFPIIPYIITPISFVFIFLLTYLFIRENRIKTTYIIYVLASFLLILIIAFVIGYSLPLMDSENLEIMGIVMVPLLCLLHFSILNKLNIYLNENSEQDIKNKEQKQKKKLPIIEYEEKKYIFSIKSLIILGFGSPFLVLFIYYFFAWQWNFWLHEIVIKQTTFFLNLFGDMGVTTSFTASDANPWQFNIPSKDPIHLETFCTGIQAICIFVGIFILTPHSKDKKTRRDVIWRKTKGIILSSLIFYVVNVIRMVIQLYLYYVGYNWEDIHYSISVASSFIAAVIVLLMHKWVPEFILSFIYVLSLRNKKSTPKQKIEKELICPNCSSIAGLKKQKICQNCGFQLVKRKGIRCINCETLSQSKKQSICEKCGSEIKKYQELIK